MLALLEERGDGDEGVEGEGGLGLRAKIDERVMPRARRLGVLFAGVLLSALLGEESAVLLGEEAVLLGEDSMVLGEEEGGGGDAELGEEAVGGENGGIKFEPSAPPAPTPSSSIAI